MPAAQVWIYNEQARQWQQDGATLTGHTGGWVGGWVGGWEAWLGAMQAASAASYIS